MKAIKFRFITIESSSYESKQAAWLVKHQVRLFELTLICFSN